MRKLFYTSFAPMSKTVTHIETAYDEETAAQISMLRAERWGTLTMIYELQTIDSAEARRRLSRHWRRIATLDAQLYKLTQNPVYNALHK